MTSSTAIVYRVSYRRDGWKAGVWKNKLFNSEGAAMKYAANLTKPVDADTPEKYRKLAQVAVQVSFGVVQWTRLGPCIDISTAVEIVRDDAAVRSWKAGHTDLDREPTTEELERWVRILEEGDG
jgi:hypothetical protein